MPMAVYQDTFNAYRTALDSDDPVMALRSTVSDELRHSSRERVLHDLEELREVLREQGQDEDAVLDVMDFLAGWCSPHERL
jgi:hypothetical protein